MFDADRGVSTLCSTLIFVKQGGYSSGDRTVNVECRGQHILYPPLYSNIKVEHEVEITIGSRRGKLVV